VALGTNAAVASAAAPTQSFLGALGKYTSAAVVDVANVMLVTSIAAALLAVQNIVARYSFSLGQDRVLPSCLGEVHPRRHAPTRAAASVALVIFVLAAVPAVLRLDPVVSYVAMTGMSFWAIVALLLTTSLSITAFFSRRRGLERSVWKTRVAPGLAFLGFAYVMFQATLNSNVLIGGSYTIAIPCILAIVAVALGATAYAWWMRSHRPQTWQRIADDDDPGAESTAAASR
jgi:amino acid transporter